MFRNFKMKIKAATVGLTVGITALTMPFCNFYESDQAEISIGSYGITAHAAENISIDDLPAEYRFAADWIWENRIVAEHCTEGGALILDQIIAGKGSINYVVRWHSYKKLTLEQRKQFQVMLSNCINNWAKWLSGYENWPYDHIDVKIVGWAVLDESCLLDRQPDEIVYTNLTDYDSSGDTSNGYEQIPDKVPNAPNELSRFYHWEHRNDPGFEAYNYPGGLDKRFDMYMWATQGFPAIGGCGGAWGQRISDDAYINIINNGFGQHVLEHEMGHGFGMTDFYGEEGEPGGFPPGGFPTANGSSIMMAGSSQEITDFDGWMLRYMWSKLSKEEGRFDISNPTIPTTETVELTDTISYVTDSSVTFAEHGTYNFGEGYYGSDESKNLLNYEAGDKISISFTYDTSNHTIIEITSLVLIENVRTVIGDVNDDGEFNISDVVTLQKWLLGMPNIKLENWKAADLCEDGKLNVFDLCLMKRMLIKQ